MDRKRGNNIHNIAVLKTIEIQSTLSKKAQRKQVQSFLDLLRLQKRKSFSWTSKEAA